MTTRDRIIERARERLESQESVYITLTDHCHFAIERQKMGLRCVTCCCGRLNGSIRERVYARAGGSGADCRTAWCRTGGYGFIALHLVTAQLNSEMPEVMHVTRVMQEILQLVKHAAS